jgi:hypothetical protein
VRCQHRFGGLTARDAPAGATGACFVGAASFDGLPARFGGAIGVADSAGGDDRMGEGGLVAATPHFRGTPRNNSERQGNSQFASDSLVEGDGFEPSVPARGYRSCEGLLSLPLKEPTSANVTVGSDTAMLTRSGLQAARTVFGDPAHPRATR